MPDDSYIKRDDDLYNRPTRAVPKNTDKEFQHDDLIDDILAIGDASSVDMASIESFTSISQQRDQLYSMLDLMSEDSTIASILETYVEDSTSPNDNGRIVWCDSSDPNIQKFVTFLLDDVGVDKHIYNWVYQLCKYGDVYLKLYHTSEVQNDLFKGKSNVLNESTVFKAYSPLDKYVHYVEAVNNPAEMFELTKFGKTAGYIQAPVAVALNYSDQSYLNMTYSIKNALAYEFNQSDVTVYGGAEFVHAALGDNVGRINEQVSILNPNTDVNDDSSYTYTYSVRRGQSILYDKYKLWREMQLLENAILLNRVTRSSIIRIVQVDVDGMNKNQVPLHLRKLKSMIEQKSSLNESVAMSEYTNPGPVENIIYVPTRGNKGAISMQNLGGDDINIGKLTDLDYFKTKMFGAFKIPPEYFGDTEDGKSWDGSTSLSLRSSRYAKTIKKIQATTIQALTDLINIYLIDKNLTSYIGRFTLKMTAPATVEDQTRRDNISKRLDLANSIVSALSEIDTVARLKALKAMWSDFIEYPEVIKLLSDEIDRLEQEQLDAKREEAEVANPNENYPEDDNTYDGGLDLDSLSSDSSFEPEEPTPPSTESEPASQGLTLPNMSDTNVDFSDANAEI